MRKDGSWVDHVVVKATARMLEKNIFIINNSKQNYVKWIDGNLFHHDPDPLCLGHILEMHYESLESVESNNT